MNDRQNTVVATVVVALILGTIFFCPWRVESSGDIKWSPIYQTPISYVQSNDDGRGNRGVSRFEYEEGKIAVDILVLQLLAVGIAGGTLYVLAADREKGSPSERFGKDPGHR